MSATRAGANNKFRLTLMLALLACGTLVAVALIARKSSVGIGNHAGSFNDNTTHNAVSPNRALQMSPPLTLPPRDGAWLIMTRVGGGNVGEGDGGVVITSEGEVAAGKPAVPDQFSYSCKAKLSASDLQAIERAVLLANPSVWKSGRYADPKNPDGCCDQFGYTLELRRREGDGSEKVYTTSWYDSSAYLLPQDLTTLHEAAVTIKRNALENCEKQQSKKN